MGVAGKINLGKGGPARRVQWQLLRRIAQWLTFLGFFVFFLLLTYPMKLPHDPRALFNLDPLTHLWLLVARKGLFLWGWAVAALVLWAILGRIFCGWICPLGSMIDFSRWFVEWFQRTFNLVPNSNRTGERASARGAQRTQRPARPDSASLKLPGSLNLWLLGVFLTLAAFGMPLIWIFDPIVLSFKFLTVAAYPALDRPVRAIYQALDSRLFEQDWWYHVNQFFNRFVLPYREPTYTDAFLILVFVIILFVLQWHHRRWWCKYVCPLGALLRISYFFSPIKRRLAPGCSACAICEVECHFSGDDVHDCFYCMQCIDKCPSKTLTFLPSRNLAAFDRESLSSDPDSGGEAVSAAELALAIKRAMKSEEAAKSERRRAVERMKEKITGINSSKPTFDRRAFIGSVAAGVIAYPFLELFNTKVNMPVDFIRPPGVKNEADFLSKCIKCGQCLKVCITNGLQPALFEAGLDGLWTPRMMNRMGYCEYECNLCGRACPTGAIPPLPLPEKKAAIMGLAYVDTTRCIPFVSRRECIVCEEHCPIPDKAIVMQEVPAVAPSGERYISKRPVVLRELCNGCGICENKCPLPSQAAIRVFREPPPTNLPTFAPDPTGFASPYGEG